MLLHNHNCRRQISHAHIAYNLRNDNILAKGLKGDIHNILKWVMAPMQPSTSICPKTLSQNRPVATRTPRSVCAGPLHDKLCEQMCYMFVNKLLKICRRVRARRRGGAFFVAHMFQIRPPDEYASRKKNTTPIRTRTLENCGGVVMLLLPLSLFHMVGCVFARI